MVLSVSSLSKYLKNLVESDVFLRSIEVEGEISNLKIHTSGHIYFSLKESSEVIRCVMFRSDAASLGFRPDNGQKVVIKGRISIYSEGGYYQIIVKRMSPDGQGILYQRFLQLKSQLEEMGMFDESYKRPIPKYANVVGVVTSPTGAAVRDIIKVARRRNPHIDIILAPAQVQGEDAPESVAKAIMQLDAYGVDVIIAGRGGGSIEDLWAFNEEIVAQAIFSSSTPIISAVGHETDVTIADFVADKRAATPSQAAELAVFDFNELADTLETFQRDFYYHMQQIIDNKRQRLMGFERELVLLSPGNMIRIKKEKAIEKQKALQYLIDNMISVDKRNTIDKIKTLRYLTDNMITTGKKDTIDRIGTLKYLMESTIFSDKKRLSYMAERLEDLSPIARLSQGYSYITSLDGENINSAKAMRADEIINIRLVDGSSSAQVLDIKLSDIEEGR